MRRLEGAAEAEEQPKRSLEEVAMTLEERVAQWPKPYIRQGLEEGIAHQRRLLRRQAVERFGTATGDRLANVLAAASDPGRLADVGMAIVRCATGDELLREVGASS